MGTGGCVGSHRLMGVKGGIATCPRPLPAGHADNPTMGSGYSADNTWTVLHALRCIGVSSEERVSTASGVPAAETRECLHRLLDLGQVAVDRGPFGGWSLTDVGRSADDESLRRQLELSDGREHVHALYQRFLGLNPTLLQVCSDWQMRKVGNAPILNDHTDSDYDAKVLSRLVRLDGSAQGLCAELTDRMAHFGVYQGRFTSALEKAMAGNHGYVADGVDSYHTMWFQLHEDLLTTLGISREEERRHVSGEDPA